MWSISMSAQSPITYDPNTRRLICQGEWSLTSLGDIQKKLKRIAWPKTGSLAFDGSNMTKLDTAGAWLLNDWSKKLQAQQLLIHFEHFNKPCRQLLSLVQEKMTQPLTCHAVTPLTHLARLGRTVIQEGRELCDFLSFTGRLFFEMVYLIKRPALWRGRALANVIESSGYQALLIIALLSMMIGVVMTYQMGLQLRNYGANIFIVDLLGLAILREFAPLLTSIMVAGRTGSSFTAQLGTMKMNQEIDALNTMGVSPAALLLLPRILGLMIALPLLTIWADIFGTLGGILMANDMLGITWINFTQRFAHVVSLSSLVIGLGKAPVFALIIASIGCFKGMKVQGSADSVGKQTTKSVVWAIFFIIIADALFSVILSKFKL